MTKTRSTKSALISSVLALVLCFTMLLGTTFAWFTDSVTSANNIIKSGTLNVEMYYAEGTEDPASADWKNANGVAIYTADQLWEPGYTDAKHIKIANEGSLALKYQLAIIPTGEVSILADVIDVYLYHTEGVLENATQIATRNDVNTAMWVGTLADVISQGIVQGNLEADTDYTTTIVLKMQEDAGNDYQDKSIGDDFTIQLLATQMTAEDDSFDNQYDADAWVSGMQVYTASDLQAAINAGEDVKLMNDITLTESIVIPASTTATYSLRSTDITIDLNGNTISGVGRDENGKVHTLVNNGILTITGGTLTSAGTNGGAVIYNYGTLTLDNVTVIGAPSDTSTGTASYAVNTDGADSKLTVVNSNISGRGVIGAANGTTVVVNGGSFHTPQVAWGHAIYAVGDGTEVTINSGTFSEGYEMTDSNWGMYQIYSGNNAKVTVNGGTFMEWDCANGYDLTTANGGTIEIKGGIFADNPSDQNSKNYVADGYHALSYNGNYIVLPENVDAADAATLIEKVKNAPVGETTTIVIAGGTYAGNIDITLAALGQQGGDVVIKAAEGATPVFTGTVTLGYYEKRVGSTRYAANVTFEGITFDHAEDGNHSISIQNIGANGDATDTAALTLTNCTVIGDGEYGIGAVSGCIAYNSTITGCTFVNAGIQVSGNFGTGLVVDGCTFTESVINVQAGNGVTVQNSTFTNTVTDANNNESFYAIRSNAIPVTVTGCTFNVDSAVTGTGVAGSKGWGVFVNRGTTDWTVSNVKVNLTEVALAQPALTVATCTSTGKINMTNVTVNGATYVLTADELATAVTNGATKIMLANGEYDMPHLGTKANGVTFIGESRDGVVVKLYNATGAYGDWCLDEATATLENMTFVTEIKDWAGFQNAHNLTFNNCKFVNNLFTTGNATFNDCEFEVTTNHYNVWAYADMNGDYTLEFNRCVFNSTGKSIYVDGNNGKLITVKFNGCTFNDDDTCATDKAAIETGNTYGRSYDISITGCTFNGFAVNPNGINTNSVIWANKASLTTDQLNVVIDDVDVY